MSPKKPDVTTLLKKVKVGRTLPTPAKGVTLLEQGVLAVIARDHSQAKAEAALSALRAAYPDWNEARVAQAQELAKYLRTDKTTSRTKGTKDWIPTARAVKTYLQAVFQKTHGLDLEFFADDLATASKLITQMPELGLYDGSYILWLAGDKSMPVHTALIRVLDRLGLITRTTSIKKARTAIEPLAPKGKELEFAATFGHVADLWCDARKPLCHECPLVGECGYGAKVYKDWQAQQARLAIQREKAEKQRLLQEKREEERRLREEKRAQKRAEQMAKKLERERLKKEKAAAAVEAKRKAAEEKKKEAERKKKEAAKEKERAKKKAEALKKKKEAERKKAAEKKKKEAAKKKALAAKKKADAAKKKAAAAKKKAATKKKASKKKVTKKKATKKKAKKVAKKKTTKKRVTKKAAKKKVTKKKATKKKAAKKKTTKRKAARRR